MLFWCNKIKDIVVVKSRGDGQTEPDMSITSKYELNHSADTERDGLLHPTLTHLQY